MRRDFKLLYEVMAATIGYITTSIDVRCEFAAPFDPRAVHALRAFLNLILFLFSHLLLTLLLFILCSIL